MLKDNLRILRKNLGLSQEELSKKLHVVRQTVSKWEAGLSVPDAEMLISISQVFQVSLGEILGENIDEKKKDDLEILSNKLELINKQLAMEQKQKQKRLFKLLLGIDLGIIFLFIILFIIGSPYQTWDYSDPEWAIIGTFWHGFEWIFFKIAPFIVILLSMILIFIVKRNNK